MSQGGKRTCHRCGKRGWRTTMYRHPREGWQHRNRERCLKSLVTSRSEDE